METARTSSPRVTVVGAGLAGVSTALEMSRHGVRVTLLDQDTRPMNRASRRTDGRVHLGFQYASEVRRRTAIQMVDGALSFAPLLRRWDVALPETSTAYHTLIHRDSIVSPEAFELHCRAVDEYAAAVLRGNPDADYLGRRPERLYRPVHESDLALHHADGEIVHAVRTEERAVDPDRLADTLAERIAADPLIDFVGGVRVRGFDRDEYGYRICAECDGQPWETHASVVVNAAGERRCSLDRTLGIAAPRELLHRLSYRVVVALPDRWRDASSMAMAVGPFGQMTVRTDGTAVLHWYPAGRTGWTHAVEPPRDWDEPASGDPDPLEARHVADGIRQALDRFVPGLGDATVLQVDAATSTACGHRDIGDRRSQLHERSDVGIRAHGRYYSIDPGAFTMAPYFGQRLGERICEQVGVRVAAAA